MNKIGIIGGGQLGLMISQEAHRLNAFSIILDPDSEAPAFLDADAHIIAKYNDVSALRRLGNQTDLLSYEFENISGETLLQLETEYYIPQGIQALLDSQDRLREKENAQAHGLKTAHFIPLPSREDLSTPLDQELLLEELKMAVQTLGIPCVLKTRQMGYDGHGQKVIKSIEDLEDALPLLQVPCILEEFIKFDYECSIILVRSEKQCIHFPIAQNIHHEGILDLSIVPAPSLSSDLETRIIKQCKSFMKSCGYYGILTIELFIKGDEFFFNEMAPRPHNSGHYTIEACTTNQFRELCKFLLGLPLEEPKLLAPTIMKNILGEDLENLKDLDKGQGVFPHVYGKTVSRPKRKMGHLTLLNLSLEAYHEHYAPMFVSRN